MLGTSPGTERERAECFYTVCFKDCTRTLHGKRGHFTMMSSRRMRAHKSCWEPALGLGPGALRARNARVVKFIPPFPPCDGYALFFLPPKTVRMGHEAFESLGTRIFLQLPQLPRHTLLSVLQLPGRVCAVPLFLFPSLDSSGLPFKHPSFTEY